MKRKRRYTEKKLESKLLDLFDRLFSNCGGHAATFEERGVLTNNRGLVLTMPNRQEFQIVIVESSRY
jgi:hypothetical protein